jgi:hypothetical protein
VSPQYTSLQICNNQYFHPIRQQYHCKTSSGVSSRMGSFLLRADHKLYVVVSVWQANTTRNRKKFKLSLGLQLVVQSNAKC